jgi:hypothetical protein
MSVNTPPTENIPIFDPSVFPSSSGTALTIASGSKYFLTYPVAQGSEIFPSNVTLQSTLSDSSGDVGTSGQLLSSTGTGVNWITSGTNGFLSLDISVLPYTLPIPSYNNLYILVSGTGSGILTIPTTGVTSGTFINIKSLLNGSLSISTSYILFSNTAVASTYLGIFNTFSAYYNGSAWVQTSMSNRTDNLTVTNTLTIGSFGVNSLIMASSGTDIDLYGTTTANDIFLGQTLPSPRTLRLCNTTAGASGASVHCANIGIDGSNINNATAPTTGIIKFANAQTTGLLSFGGGSTTAARTTGPILIGSDSTASGGINIGTGTNLSVPTVNTVNIGSATYGTFVKGALTVNGLLTADGGITLPSGDTITVTGTIGGTGNISTSGNISTTGTGTITAANGLTTSKPLTLQSTWTAPTNTQLGYTSSVSNPTAITLTSSTLTNFLGTGINLPNGVCLISFVCTATFTPANNTSSMTMSFNESSGTTLTSLTADTSLIMVGNSTKTTFMFTCIMVNTNYTNLGEITWQVTPSASTTNVSVITGDAKIAWVKIA